MGSPKKQRKKFSKPTHPWQKERILAEQELVKEYGLNRKYELWKMNSVLRNLTRQAKNLIATKKPQAEKEAKQLLTKLHSLGIINKEAQVEDVLSLSLKDIMERRLQTLVYRKNLASSARQARQFIVHEHIALGEKTVTAPSYLVPVDEEANIGFSQGSVLSNADHPQRSAISEVKTGKRKEKQGKKESSDKAEKKKEESGDKNDNKEEKAAKTEKKDHASKGDKQKKKEGGK
ncbi:30S ribosomal protein S4 [Candidatus Woesearchaeota archaeon]|nr:30S ribosomal protein S4 [Candidatus Woesearchaeota archaeon]